MRFTQEEKDIIHRVHLLSGKSYEETLNLFESFCLVAVLAYLEKEPISIPMFGKMEVKYVGDHLTDNGKEADLEVTLEPGKFFKRNIGQIEDKEESDLEKILQTRIANILSKLV